MSRPLPRKTGATSAEVAASLLGWFAANARDLPWRRTLDPYAIWVSEIMLQQTQVRTVIPFFERWMRQLPTIAALADADSTTVHKLWEGLGYYTRVRNLQKAAQKLEADGAGFPDQFPDVLALPGIGRYTAGAICSIAFNQPAAIVDGNIIRVLTRLFGIAENTRDKNTLARLWMLAQEIVDASAAPSLGGGRPSAYKLDSHALVISGRCSGVNQAMMELGALLCTPRAPQCGPCPLAARCVGRKRKLLDSLPNVGTGPDVTARRFVAAIAEKDGRVLVRQRPAGVVNAHLWEFPNVEVSLAATAGAIKSAMQKELGCRLEPRGRLRTIKHSITRYRITLEAFTVQLKGRSPAARAGTWKAPATLAALAFTSAHRKLARLLI